MKSKSRFSFTLLLAALLFVDSSRAQSNVPPVIVLQPQSQLVTNITNVSFSVGVTGPGSFTYQWLLNGTNLPNNIITTVVGNGVTNLFGAPRFATNYNVASPASVAADNEGNLFIADIGHGIIPIDHAGVIITNVVAGYITVAPGALALDSSGGLFIAIMNQNQVDLEIYGSLLTVAGSGAAGYSGDGGQAKSAELNGPSGVALDADGNVFIADTSNARIREVTADDVITTVAGNGTNTFSGDGGPATQASLNKPRGVTVDPSGDLFIADTLNNRIRKVDTSGIITTVAGNGTAGYSGDGSAATNAALFQPAGVIADDYGDLFIADTHNSRIRKVDPFGTITSVAGNGLNGFSGDGGAATNASLNYPSGLTQDTNGNLYISDTTNNRIREVAIQGPVLIVPGVNFTNAGNYQVIVSSAFGSVTSSLAVLTVDQAPAITRQPLSQSMVNDANASFKVGTMGSPLLTFQWQFNGTNLPSAGQFQGTTNDTLTVDQVSTANDGNYDVIISNAWGSVTSSVAGLTITEPPEVTTQPASQNLLFGQNAAVSVGIAGTGPFSYQWFLNGTALPTTTITTVAGNGTNGYSGDGAAATNAALASPDGLAIDGNGNVFVADTENNRIRKIDTNGLITTVAGNETGTFSGDGGAATNASLFYPKDVAVDTAGDLFIADSANFRIRKVAPNGLITTVAGNGTNGYTSFGLPEDGGPATNANIEPLDVIVDAAGNLYFSDSAIYAHQQIRQVDTNGIITTVAGDGFSGYFGDGGPATTASLYNPQGLSFDASGNLFIADLGNSRVRKVDAYGIITTVAGNGTTNYSGDGGPAVNASFDKPEGVAVDAAENLFIADSGNDRIREGNPLGVITTVAGSGTAGYSGDGEIATNASLYEPYDVAVDANGNLFIADAGNNRIRKVTFQGPALPLASVNAATAGNYQVIVSSPWGSVTSSIATLTISLPAISAVPNINGSVTLNLQTAPNTSSRLLAATNLTPPVVWLPLSTNLPGNTGVWQFTDTNASQFPVRFYRSSVP